MKPRHPWSKRLNPAEHFGYYMRKSGGKRLDLSVVSSPSGNSITVIGHYCTLYDGPLSEVPRYYALPRWDGAGGTSVYPTLVS